MDIGQFVAIVTAVGGLLVGTVSLFTVRAQQRKLRAEVDRLGAASDKDDADAAKVLGETAVLLLAPAKKQIAEMQKRLEVADHNARELAEQLRSNTSHANELDEQLRMSNTRVTILETRISALTDRLELAQGLLTEHGVPFPPLREDR